MKPEDITEEYIRANFDIESNRKSKDIARQEYGLDASDLDVDVDDYIDFDDYINKLVVAKNKKVENFDMRRIRGELSVKIRLESSYYCDGYTTSLTFMDAVKETDEEVVARLFKSEKKRIVDQTRKSLVAEKKRIADIKLAKELAKRYPELLTLK